MAGFPLTGPQIKDALQDISQKQEKNVKNEVSYIRRQRDSVRGYSKYISQPTIPDTCTLLNIFRKILLSNYQ